MEHIALKVPEKADYRHAASRAILELLQGLPMSHYSRLVKWFFILAHNDRSAYRQFSIEVMGRLLAESERKKPTETAHGEHDYGSNIPNGKEATDEESGTEEDEGQSKSNVGLFSSHKFLFGMIFSRCKDSSALVRAKALQTMADVTATASDNNVVADLVKNLFDTDRPNDDRYDGFK